MGLHKESDLPRRLQRSSIVTRMIQQLSSVVFKRPTFERQCTHVTMTRIYGPDHVCENCRRSGPFGWLYRCSQDREDMIEQAVADGDFTNCDQLSKVLISTLELDKCSRRQSQDKFSFLDRLSTSQMKEYRPDQRAMILRQRELVQLSIQRDQGGKTRRSSSSQVTFIRSGRQWYKTDCLPPQRKSYTPSECQYIVCPRCRPGCIDRCLLSLNAVADGDILPTAATGYGFHMLGGRPVNDANLLKNMHYTAAPVSHTETTSEVETGESLTELLEHHFVFGLAPAGLATEGRSKLPTTSEEQEGLSHSTQPAGSLRGRLKHSPRCEDLSTYVGAISGNQVPCSARVYESAPWTNTTKAPMNEYKPKKRLEFHTSRQTGASMANQSPLADVTTKDVLGSHLPLKEVQFGTAAKTQNGSSNFNPGPLHLHHGVAMLEESVELGLPDVITTG